LENKLIDWLFRAQSFTPPATMYIALATTTPTDTTTGATLAEVSGGNYSRQAVVSASTTWSSTQGDNTVPSTGTGGTTSNLAAITWSGVTWGATVQAVAILDGGTPGAGNMLFWGALSSSKVVSSGDTFTFSISSLSVQLD